MISLFQDYGAIILLIFAIMFGPPLLFTIIGVVFSIKKRKKTAKGWYIAALVYLIVGLGFCGSLYI